MSPIQKLNEASRFKLASMSDPSPSISPATPDVDLLVIEVLRGFPALKSVVIFGSVAKGQHHAASDLDIAVGADRALTATEKINIISALAQRTGRPVDLVDLRVVAEPLLGQILRHGRRLLGSDADYGRLISKHVFEQTDFMPYRNRMLAERRMAWIGK